MARGFKIAEGYVEITTRVDGNEIRQAVAKVSKQVGEEAGRDTSRSFKRSFHKEAERDTAFMPGVFKKLFKHDPKLMRTLLHPIEATFARPIAAILGSTLAPLLIGGISAALSSAVLLGIGTAVPAAGVAILLGNEKVQKKLAQTNLTRVRKDASVELGQMRATLRARLANMKAAGASEKEIRAVRIAGEREIANKALAWQNKITEAAKNTSQSVTQMFKDAGVKILDVLTEAAQPMVGPLRLALENIVELFSGKGAESGLLPILKELFTWGGKLVPYFVDIFSTLAFRILPAVVDIMPQVVKMFDVLAGRAPELADAIVRLLIAMADPSTIKVFDILLTFIIKLTDAVAFLIPILNTLFIKDIRLWEGEIHFLQGAPGRISAAWRNLIGWFKTGFKSFIDFFKAIGRGAMDIASTIADTFRRWRKSIADAVSGVFRTVSDAVVGAFNAVLDFFQKLPARISRFIVNLPRMLVGIMVLALEGMVYVVGYNLGLIYDFFSKLPGRLYRTTSEVIRVLTDTFARAFRAAVGWFERLPGRLVALSNLAMNATQRVIAAGLRAIVDFFAKLPGRVVGALSSLGRVLLGIWNSAWGRTFRAVVRIGSDIINWIQRFPARIFAALAQLAPRLLSRIISAWSSADKTTRSWNSTITRFITGLPGRIWSALVRLKDRLVERFASGWSAATGASKQKVIDMINFVLGIPGRILRALSRIPGLLTESGRQLIQGFLVGVQRRISEIGGLGGWFRTNLVDPVVRAVRNFFGIRSPSTVFAGIGQNIVAGLWRGIADHNPVKMVNKIFGSMPKALGKLLEKGMVSVANLPNKALKALGSLWGTIGDFFGGGGKSSGTGGTVGAAAAAWKILQAMFGLPMGGYRATGSVPGSDHPKGKAIDVMTTNPALHKAIIAFARSLPGLKYWISMRQIATASGGWVPRAYHGPSPHTDHVHLSFFNKGGRLPEDIFGMGASGRGYVMHKDETVVPKGGDTINRGNVVNHYHVSFPNVRVKDLEDMQKVVDLVSSIKPTARAGQRISHQAA